MSKEPKEYAWDDPALEVIIKLGVKIDYWSDLLGIWKEDTQPNPKAFGPRTYKYRIRPNDWHDRSQSLRYFQPVDRTCMYRVKPKGDDSGNRT